MLRFYYNTNKIIRIMFIVSVSVIRCWLCSSTNHNSARCLPSTHPPPSVHSVTQSATWSSVHFKQSQSNSSVFNARTKVLKSLQDLQLTL